MRQTWNRSPDLDSRPDARSPGEIVALLTSRDDDTRAGARDAALIGVLVACGLRRAEVGALVRSDYDREARSLRVKGNGNRERRVPLEDGGADALEDWLQVRGESGGALFPAINKATGSFAMG